MKAEITPGNFMIKTKRNSFICHSLVPHKFFPKCFVNFSFMNVIRSVKRELRDELGKYFLFSTRWRLRFFEGCVERTLTPHLPPTLSAFYHPRGRSDVRLPKSRIVSTQTLFTIASCEYLQRNVLRHIRKKFQGLKKLTQKIKQRILLFYYARCGLFPSRPKWVSR